MFTLTISCLVTCNLPWFMDLTFQVPTQYFYLQHWTLLPLPVTYTTVRCFCFDSVSSFFLELFLHTSLVANWALTNLGGSSFSVISFWLFVLFMGFSRHECWSGLSLPSPWTTMEFCQSSPPWPVHLGWPYTAWLIISLRPNYARVMVTSSKRTHANTSCLPGLLQSVPLTPRRPLLTRVSARDSQIHTGTSASVSYGITAPFSWVLVCTRFCLCPPRVSVYPVLWKLCNQIPLTFKVRFPGDSQSLCWIHQLGSLM